MFEIMICSMLIIIATVVLFAISFKHCSEYEIFVVYNKKDGLKPRKIVVPKGFTFVNPLSDKYAHISLLNNVTFTIKDNIFDENEYEETFECCVKVCEDKKYYGNIAENLVGLDRKDIIELAKNIIKKELKEISRDVMYTDFFNQNNYEKYFKQINKKLNNVGLELKDI